MIADTEVVTGAYQRVAGALGVDGSRKHLEHLARNWIREERTGAFRIGHPDSQDVAALVLVTEAARMLCAVERGAAAALLRAAADRLEAVHSRDLSEVC